MANPRASTPARLASIPTAPTLTAALCVAVAEAPVAVPVLVELPAVPVAAVAEVARVVEV